MGLFDSAIPTAAPLLSENEGQLFDWDMDFSNLDFNIDLGLDWNITSGMDFSGIDYSAIPTNEELLNMQNNLNLSIIIKFDIMFII